MNAADRRLDVDAIREATSRLALRPELHYEPVVDSTNRVLRDLPAHKWRSGTVVLTDFQEAGRGRKGRSWHAPACSSLLLSVALELPPRVAPADGIMMMALAVADAIADVVGLAPALKWPNDVLIHGKKTCGILAEYDEQAGRRRLVLGVGINVSADPSDAGVPGATCLAREAGGPIRREDLAIALFNSLDVWYRALTKEPDTVFDGWASRLDTVGRMVRVVEADREWDGFAINVLRSGGLQVRTTEGDVRTVYAADVSVRTESGFTTP